MASADTAALERIVNVVDVLQNSDFPLQRAKERFQAKEQDFREMSDSGSALSINPHNPRLVGMDVHAQLSYLRKLKTAFIQSNAKLAYVKALLKEEFVTAEENQELREENAERKRKLKERKEHLRATWSLVRERSAALATRYEELLATAETSRQAARDILEAQIQLSRLRAAHPPPRWTVRTANEHLDRQVETLVDLDEAKTESIRRLREESDKVKALQDEIAELRSKQADAEEKLAVLAKTQGDIRVIEQNDWSALSLEHYEALLGLSDVNVVSANEIQLKIDGLLLSVIFVRDTPKLAAARLLNSDMDIEQLAINAVKGNDVVGLVQGIRHRLLLRSF